MWTLELLTRPLIWGASKGAQLALRGASALRNRMAARAEKLGMTAAEYAINRSLDAATGGASAAARAAGRFAQGAVDAAGGYVDVASAAARPLIRQADNFMGWQVREGFGDFMLLAGFPIVGLAAGLRPAKVGLVDYGDMTAVTGAPMTPNLSKQNIRPHWIDNLGADGELALALHQLRRG